MPVGTGHSRLRELRTESGLTQKGLAERLAHLVWMQHSERVGINADVAAKRERDAISPYKYDLYSYRLLAGSHCEPRRFSYRPAGPAGPGWQPLGGAQS